jgi:pilus assembly protein CpaD
MTRLINGARSMATPRAAAKALVLGLLVSGLAACTRLDDYTAAELNEPPKRHPIGYTPHTEALLVEIPAAGGLSANQQADVVRFVDRYKKEGTGRLQLSAPRSAGAHLAASKSMRQVEGILDEAGVDPDAIEIGRHNSGGRNAPTVKLAYEKPVALPPQCRDWATNLGENRERLPYNDFGCATQRNFALTVANARDLQVPQPEISRSAEKRSAGWDEYTGRDQGSGSGAAAAAPAAPAASGASATTR